MDNPEQQVNGEQAAEKRQRPHFEDNGHTPGWLKDFVFSKFELTHDAEGTDIGLAWPKDSFVFQHPPHDEAEIWCGKAAREVKNGANSLLLLPAVFNSIYWRTTVYQHAAEIYVLTCPLKKPGAKKQIVSQMCLAIFAPRPEGMEYPPVFFMEPDGWENEYYKRQRNKARFALRQ